VRLSFGDLAAGMLMIWLTTLEGTAFAESTAEK